VRVTRGGRAILRGVDVEAAAGEVLGVLGPSGAGKSTLFRVLVGEARADAGSVVVDGEDMTSWPLWRRARSRIGYVPQGPSVLWDMSVRSNLLEYRRIARLDPADPTEVAQRVGLAHRLDVPAAELSAGERRRLEVARALTRPPRVLVCDEPFAGVDPAGSERLANLLRDLAAGGATVLVSDHHVAEALRICTRALLLVDGRVETAASADAFLELPEVKRSYLGR
jgi:lipopolysaccharide export system ATP-binding protein